MQTKYVYRVKFEDMSFIVRLCNINYVQPIKWNNLNTFKFKALYIYILNYVQNLLKSRSTHGSCFYLILKKDQFLDCSNNT
jgi:hypothetical protein